jgi:hypothetical protein
MNITSVFQHDLLLMFTSRDQQKYHTPGPRNGKKVAYQKKQGWTIDALRQLLLWDLLSARNRHPAFVTAYRIFFCSALEVRFCVSPIVNRP